MIADGDQVVVAGKIARPTLSERLCFRSLILSALKTRLNCPALPYPLLGTRSSTERLESNLNDIIGK